MKATLKITTSGDHLGVTDDRSLTFSTRGIMHLANVVLETLKDFSADRTKRRMMLHLTINKKETP